MQIDCWILSVYHETLGWDVNMKETVGMLSKNLVRKGEKRILNRNADYLNPSMFNAYPRSLFASILSKCNHCSLYAS